MGLKVAATSLHWSQPTVPHSPSSSQALASAISSPSSRWRSCDGGAVFCRFAEKSVVFLGAYKPFKLNRSRSCDGRKSQIRTVRRALTACLNSFSDENFSTDDDDRFENVNADSSGEARFENRRAFDGLEVPDFPERDEIIPANIERKANRVEIPLSLRMIKKKKQWQEGVMEAGESAYCSVKKAFSSMVFIIRELHSFTLQMREVLFYEDLQGILATVQREMNASFVWLFQKVFAHTPTLMVYVMILLANYSVYSMSSNAAIAAMAPIREPEVVTEQVSAVEDQSPVKNKFDSSIVKSLKLSSSSGKTASVGGNNGGGGKFRPVASGTDGFDESNYYSTIAPDGVSSVGRASGDKTVSSQEEEAALWDSIEEEASRMQAASRDEALDHETMMHFVSPVDAKVEDDNPSEYIKTELTYQTELAQDPNNPLLLANYAQFLYLIAQDYDRAEDYFKKATNVEPKDAEALNKYATFLWLARNDLWAAEETFLEAISADPNNSFYTANYAHFLWNTGAEDTCFPLSPPDTNIDL